MGHKMIDCNAMCLHRRRRLPSEALHPWTPAAANARINTQGSAREIEVINCNVGQPPLPSSDIWLGLHCSLQVLSQGMHPAYVGGVHIPIARLVVGSQAMLEESLPENMSRDLPRAMAGCLRSSKTHVAANWLKGPKGTQINRHK